MAQNYTQNVSTRRNAVAILTMAPLAAAISVSPAPFSNVEKLEARLVVMRRNARTHVRELVPEGRRHDGGGAGRCAPSCLGCAAAGRLTGSHASG
jgi:hypothetical protein